MFLVKVISKIMRQMFLQGRNSSAAIGAIFVGTPPAHMATEMLVLAREI